MKKSSPPTSNKEKAILFFKDFISYKKLNIKKNIFFCTSSTKRKKKLFDVKRDDACSILIRSCAFNDDIIKSLLLHHFY